MIADIRDDLSASVELDPFKDALDSEGLVVLPPEVTGVSMASIDRCSEALLRRFYEETGCEITIEDGPLGELAWPHEVRPGFLSNPDQVGFAKLLACDRSFRDLTVNPIVDALIDHLMGRLPPSRRHPAGQKTRRFSSAQGLVKWQGESGYRASLGLHSDQGALGVFAPPRPYCRAAGTTAFAANATWCLTDYTGEGGALAYVPGSHRIDSEPGPDAASEAIAVEAPRGSAVVFHGATWHGAFPRLTPGVRLTYVAYYRHASIHSQENFKITMGDGAWRDCDDPDTLRELLGLDDMFPYTKAPHVYPEIVGGARGA